MKLFKNIGVGFLVSFIGSVPLGYLNIAGYEIFSGGGWAELLPYLCGVVIVEAVTIYATVVFAEKLSKRKKLIRYIEIFSIIFMLTLAVVFFFSSGHHEKDNFFRKYFNHSPFVIGVILSAINFMQIPFWIAWNLYVVNKKYISVELPMRFAYVAGTVIGTFVALMGISVGLEYLGRSSEFLSDKIMPYLFPVVFLAIAIYQSIRYYRKYHLHKGV